MTLLSDAKVQERLADLDGWERSDSTIERTFEFDAFPDAVEFVNQVADRAEAANHHPDIDIRYDQVTLALSTHSEGGLTDKDFDLAAEVDAIGSGAS